MAIAGDDGEIMAPDRANPKWLIDKKIQVCFCGGFLVFVLLLICFAQMGPCCQPVETHPPGGGRATTAMAGKDDYQVSAGNGSSTQGCL